MRWRLLRHGVQAGEDLRERQQEECERSADAEDGEGSDVARGRDGFHWFSENAGDARAEADA